MYYTDHLLFGLIAISDEDNGVRVHEYWYKYEVYHYLILNFSDT